MSPMTGEGTDDLPAFLAECGRRYCWDMSAEEVERRPDRVLLRTMDIATWEDVLSLERIAGQVRLTETLKKAPHGALRGRSWSFWHYRIGLSGSGEEPPPQPGRMALE